LDELLTTLDVLYGLEEVLPVSSGPQEILGLVLYFLDDDLYVPVLIGLIKITTSEEF